MKNKKINLTPEKIGNIKGVHRFIKRDVKTNEIVSDNTYENLIPTVCLNMIADRLVGGSNNTDITYGAVGTGAGTPAIGDTTLSTENARNLLAGISVSGSVITATTFFGAAEANATLTNFGLFGNGATGSADSGTMITIVSITETKTSSETLTVESQITIA